MDAGQGQGTSVRGGAGTSGALEQRLASLDKRLNELVQADRRGRIGLLAASAGLLLIVLWFASSLWRMADERFTQEKLQAAFMAKVDVRWPSIQQKLLDEVTEAAPAYTTLAGERAIEILPELSDRFVETFSQIGPELEQEIRTRAEEAMRRVTMKVAEDLRTDFPSFTPERATAIAQRIHDELLADGGGFLNSLDAVIKEEEEKVLGILAKLPVDAAAEQPNEELHKQFTHHVLMMIDAFVAQDKVLEVSAFLDDGQGGTGNVEELPSD